MALRLAVVEDDALARLSLVAALQAQNMNIVFDCATAAEALELASEKSIDVALLDLHLGRGPTGIDVARQLRKTKPELGIVFLTSFADPRLLNPEEDELPGNSVYLVKSDISDISLLTNAIYRSVVGGSVKGPKKTGSIFDKFTQTQIETLRLVALGYSNSEIARERFMTIGSVETSITRVAKSLGLDKDVAKNQRVHMARVFFRSIGQKYTEDE